MTDTTFNAIWVFGDLRTRHLLNLSLKVVAKAAVLATKTGDAIVMFSLTATEPTWLTMLDDETCAIQGIVEDEAIAWGANVVYLFENERFSTPSPIFLSRP
jgi:electron transfer flavoprotein alpha subunit